MLNGSSHDGMGHMEGAQKAQSRGGDGVWLRLPDIDGGTIPLGKTTGASGDELLLVEAIMSAS